MRRQHMVAVGVMAVCLVLPVNSRAETGSFAWYGELLSIDRAEKTVTVRALARENVAAFLDKTDMQSGAPLIVIWEVQRDVAGDAPNVLAVAAPDQLGAISHGYMTPVEYVAVDGVGQSITFRVHVSDAVLRVAESLQPGRWLKVTAPMERSSSDAALLAAAPAEQPELKPRTSPQVPKAVAAPRPSIPAVVANGGISGPWELRYKTPLATTTYMACDLAQDGPLIGGSCTMPGMPRALPVAGRADGMHFELQIPAGGTLYTGELDAAGTTILGTVESMGAEVDFKLTAGRAE